jgi:hypothetical protein
MGLMVMSFPRKFMEKMRINERRSYRPNYSERLAVKNIVMNGSQLLIKVHLCIDKNNI